ncbi:MAG: ROK family protein [Acidobacteriota bacterium]|nr:ROK family protein [Acidobacteriota bacterium]
MRLGIDLGGTKTEIIAIDREGRELFRTRLATPRGDYAATIDTIRTLVHSAEAALGARGASVGVGIPGIESPATGLVKNANSTWLLGHRLSADLEAALARPVRLANDANCFAMSEAADGAAAGAASVFGVILGTGVGGGIVIGGRLVQGVNAIAGEWGHNALPWAEDDERPGPRCYCGRSGCIESFLSGPALAGQFGHDTGLSWTAEMIVAAAGAGDARADAAMRRYEHRLGRALASVINVLDPDVIVLGGGLSNVERLYASVPGIWGQWVFSDQVATKLMKNRHGDSSGVRGAAGLWPAERYDEATGASHRNDRNP